MYQIVILNSNNEILDKRFFLKQPEESQIQTFWVESLNRFGALIMLQINTLRYAEM